jgi:RHS repeat-associated protein
LAIDDSVTARNGLTGRAAVGHPVDVASGAVFTAAHDFDLPGTMPLLWRRHYATDSAAHTVLGPRWTTPFLMTLDVRPDGWYLVEEDGLGILFERPPGPLDVGDRLQHPNASMELWRQADGYTIVHWHHGASDLEIWHFRGAANTLPLVAIENAAGHRFRIEHDDGGRPVRITQEIEQRRLGLDYNDRGLLASVQLEHTDIPPTTLVQYTYDSAGRLATARDATGGVMSYEYDTQGRLLLERNPLGSAYHFRYDSRGRCVLASGDRRYLYRRLSYQARGQIVNVSDSLGHTRRYVLNGAGQVLQEISPTGLPRTTEYDAAGRITREINADGTARAYEYDSVGHRVGMTFEDGTSVRMTYNDSHALTSYTDALGSTWRLDHDDRNQLVGVVNPLGHRFATPRDRLGFVTATVSPLGRTTRRAYGPQVAWWEARDEIGLQARYEFDAFGNAIVAHDAAGVRYRVRYDLRNRPVEVTDALGHRWTWRYNALGEITERTRPNGMVEQFDYDTFGQMIGHRTSLGVMRFGYDSEGRLTEVVNRNGERYVRSYDPDGRISREVFFDGREQRHEWNNRNRISCVVRSDGIEVSYRYGLAGEVISIQSSGGLDHEYEYDARGYLVAATAPGSRIGFGFDVAGRLVWETQNDHRIDNEYDADNFCIRRRLLGMELAFSHDARGRLVAIADGGGSVQRLRWNALDQPSERFTPEGIVEQLSWRRDDRLLAQIVRDPAGAVRAERRYGYDTAGDLVSIDDTAHGRLRLAYDSIGRLTRIDDATGPREFYRYDAIGAILETHRGVRETGPNGRTLRDGVHRYAYDEAGALVSATHADGVQTRYEYDARGQMRRATLPNGTVVDYTYDALWRRCARRSAGQTTQYVYSGALLAAEQDSSRGNRVFTGLEFHPLAEWHEDARRFVVSDLSNMPREVLAVDGSVLWSGAFEAYGAPLWERGSVSERQRLPGQFADSLTGLADNFHRSFDPSLGAYLSPDPIGLIGGADHYGYPRNPFVWFDPFGLKCAAHKAEDNMDDHFDKKGYDKIGPDPPKDLNTPGIDGVYKARPGKGPPEYIIGEAKSSQSGRLGETQMSGQQMSDKWVNTPVGSQKDDRLTAAVGATNAAEIRASAATPGNVEKSVFSQPGGTGTPTVTSQPYNPTGKGTTF